MERAGRELLRIDPENRFIHGILAKVFSTTPKKLKELTAGSFIYAGLFLTEGVGLVLRKHWAEYLTVITTSALIPLEVYELAKRFSFAKLAILAVNVVIVWYLIARIRVRRRELRQTPLHSSRASRRPKESTTDTCAASCTTRRRGTWAVWLVTRDYSRRPLIWPVTPACC